MFTTCPKCALNLAVTAADLRVGQGYVRCGRCSNVFNALIGLSDDLPEVEEDVSILEDTAVRERLETTAEADAATAGAVTDGTEDEEESEDTVEALAPTEDEVVEIVAMESDGSDGSDEEADDDDSLPPALDDSMIVEEVALPGEDYDEHTSEAHLEAQRGAQREAETEALREVVREMPRNDDRSDDEGMPPEGTGTFETIVLEGDTILQTEEVVGENEVEAQIQAISDRLDARASEPRDPPASFEAWHPEAEAPAETAAGTSDLVHEFARDFSGEGRYTPEELARGRRLRGVTTAACIVLLLLLAAQAVHHWRQDLADIAPLAPAVKGLYAALGKPIEPRWDVRAYEVRRVGDAALRGLDHDIVLRASVHNTASIAQPLPLLRVTLQDLNGNDIGLRDVEPAEYLAHTPAASRPGELAPDERVDAEIVVVDAANKAEGFELDACLRSLTGALQCAAGQAQRNATR